MLFLETPQPSLSFIYQSLGCYHTLQPDKNPYAPPSIPALTPQGFVRWQTIQLLLEPEEHVPLLQAAVKRFDISNPVDGNPFPSWLPREALPSKPDPEMLQWHDRVSDNLMIEVQKSQARRIPNMHARALSDVTSEGTLESSRDSHSRGSSTTDDQSLVNVGTHFTERRPRPFFKPPEPLYMPPGNRPPPQQWGTSKGPLPWNPERQRSNSDPQHHRSSSSNWSQKEGAGRRNTVVRSDTHPRSRPRSPSTVSTSTASSTTSDSSSSSDESDDHARRRTSSTATLQPARSRSSHSLNSPPNTHASRQPSPITHTSTFPLRPASQHDTSSTLPQYRQPVPARANTRGLNVRWGADSVHDISPGRIREKAAEGKSRAKSEERPRRSGDDDENSIDNERGATKGVGGRRYPNNGRAGWR